MRRLLALISVVTIGFIGLAFAVLNAGTVELKYYLGTLSMPLALLLVIVLLIGALWVGQQALASSCINAGRTVV